MLPSFCLVERVAPRHYFGSRIAFRFPLPPTTCPVRCTVVELQCFTSQGVSLLVVPQLIAPLRFFVVSGFYSATHPPSKPSARGCGYCFSVCTFPRATTCFWKFKKSTHPPASRLTPLTAASRRGCFGKNEHGTPSLD